MNIPIQPADPPRSSSQQLVCSPQLYISDDHPCIKGPYALTHHQFPHWFSPLILLLSSDRISTFSNPLVWALCVQFLPPNFRTAVTFDSGHSFSTLKQRCSSYCHLETRNVPTFLPFNLVLLSSRFHHISLRWGSGWVKFCHPRFSAKLGLRRSIQLGENFLLCLIIAANYAGPRSKVPSYYRVVCHCINTYFSALENFPLYNGFIRFLHSYMNSNDTFDFELPERSGD